MSSFARHILRQSLPRIFRLVREHSETCPSCSGSQQIQNERRPSVSSTRGLTWFTKKISISIYIRFSKDANIQQTISTLKINANS
jgi:hypothetical protein